MKICHVINSLNRGGAESHLLELAKAQNNEGLLIDIVVIGKDNKNIFSIEQELIKCCNNIVRLNGPRMFNLFSYFKLKNLIKNNEYNIIHSHQPRSDYMIYILKKYVFSKTLFKSDLNSSKQSYKKTLNNLEEYFSQSTTSYLFAFYLQNSVPKGIKINSYSFSDNGFDINLSSYSLDSINEFITLIIESPVINKNSVTINQINRLESNSSEGEKVSTMYDLEIYGQTAKIDIKKREDLYKESNANGLLRKLQRFNYLKSLLRG